MMIVTMNYYNLNIKQLKNPDDPKGDKGDRISWASRCLDVNSPDFLFKNLNDKRPRAPIFYGNATIEMLLNGTAPNQPDRAESKKFCEIGREENAWQQTEIVTIHEGMVWIYKPVGQIEEFKPDEIAGLPKHDSMKCFPVKILYEGKQRDVPLILASQRSNQAFSRGTFKRILPEIYPGNICAIEHLRKVKGGLDVARLDRFCSLEFETLVAKIFEEAGCFVPAYKGGLMEGIDLVVCNDGVEAILVHGITVPAGKRISLQLKLRSSDLKKDRGYADFLIVNQSIDKEVAHCFGRAWVDACLKKDYSNSRKWLDRTTDWSHFKT